MNLAVIESEYYCGIDLHKKSMYVCIMDRSGKIFYHQNMPCNFESFLLAAEPYLPNLAVGVEAMYCYYWLFDCCQEAGIPFYLGHPLYMKAVHGGKKKNDRLDSRVIADLMRSNHLPIAYPYPKEKRPTRDLLRRRHRLVRIRSECYAHIQTLFSQNGILDITSNQVKSKKTRRQLINKFSDTELKAAVETDLDLTDFLDPVIRKLEIQITRKAKQHNKRDFNILLSIPGVGETLSLIIIYEIDTIDRFFSVQDFSSYCRLVKCDRSSAGKKTGGGNQKIGNPYLKWAFGEIIIKAKNTSPLIAKYYQRLQSKFGPGRAKSIIAHKFGVAVYFMLKNGKAFDENLFVQTNMK